LASPVPEVQYRFADDHDVPDVVALVESAYRGAESLTGWTSEAELISGQRTDAGMLRELYAEPGGHVLLAEQGGVLQVCCELREPASAGRPAYFGMLAVRPSVQTGGYGRAMLAEAERIARDEFGATSMEMTVIRQRGALIAWYERRGYRRTGELRPFPYGDDRYGTPRVDDLEFAVLAKPLT
jgi:ribosomal protein S18 acetylase RimI-like enzyme